MTGSITVAESEAVPGRGLAAFSVAVTCADAGVGTNVDIILLLLGE